MSHELELPPSVGPAQRAIQAPEPSQQPRNYTIIRSFTDDAIIGRLHAVMLHKRLVLEPQAGLAGM